ncbi:hypothetical protein KEM55_008001 [Ascosphaera atra]|nr:hypothetical protein KEM55_008001 [Ascosphaera atra]
MTGPVIPLPFEYPRQEKHPKFQAFPTYPIVLTFKHDSPSTIDFLARNASAPLPPNCPPLNWSTAVDGGRRLIIYRPLPVSSDGNDRFEVRSRVLAVYDKGEGKGTVLEQEHCVVERETGEEFTRSYETK